MGVGDASFSITLCSIFTCARVFSSRPSENLRYLANRAVSLKLEGRQVSSCELEERRASVWDAPDWFQVSYDVSAAWKLSRLRGSPGEGGQVGIPGCAGRGA